MSWSDVGETACPIAQALAIVGDRWTVLVLRELFLGGRRFDALQAQTGISPHLLSRRLKRLELEGVLARRRYSERPVRHEYRLTDKGIAFYPVMLALKSWGETWLGSAPDAEPALTVSHLGCGGEVGVRARCATCDDEVGARAATVRLGQAYSVERQERHYAA